MDNQKVPPAVGEFAVEDRQRLLAKVEEQAREIERLKRSAQTNWNEFADTVKTQPSGVVQWPDADEIMQMAFEEGQPGDDASGYYFELEEFDLFVQRLMEEVARLNPSPVSAGEAE